MHMFVEYLNKKQQAVLLHYAHKVVTEAGSVGLTHYRRRQAA